MGCRVSVQFTKKGRIETDESPIIYHHWAGNDLPKEARKFLHKFYKTKEEGWTLSEPSFVLFKFIQYLFKIKKLSLDKEHRVSIENPDYDNFSEDAGHYIFELKKSGFEMTHIEGNFQSEKPLKVGNYEILKTKKKGG